MHTAPDFLDPSKISETATLANAALVRFALDNDEKGEGGLRLSEQERKDLNISRSGAAALDMFASAAKNGVRAGDLMAKD